VRESWYDQKHEYYSGHERYDIGLGSVLEACEAVTVHSFLRQESRPIETSRARIMSIADAIFGFKLQGFHFLILFL
jgi:hypothetical protein